MISDAERREVARRLREAASRYESMGRDVDFYPVESALGLKPAGETAYAPESVRSLADLIEPSERACYYYDAETNHCRCYDTRLIDRDALLALAKVLHDMGEQYDVHGRYELGTTFKAIAGRIRKAVGR